MAFGGFDNISDLNFERTTSNETKRFQIQNVPQIIFAIVSVSLEKSEMQMNHHIQIPDALIYFLI